MENNKIKRYKMNNNTFGNFTVINWNGKTEIITTDIKNITEVDLDFFINAVEYNNHYNNGKWSDWYNSEEIIETYTSTEDIEYLFIKDIDYIKKHLDYMIKNL